MALTGLPSSRWPVVPLSSVLPLGLALGDLVAGVGAGTGDAIKVRHTSFTDASIERVTSIKGLVDVALQGFTKIVNVIYMCSVSPPFLFPSFFLFLQN